MISPWTFGLGGALVALSVGFGVGLRLGEAHLAEFRAQVDAAGARQAARAAQTALTHRELKEKTDERHRMDQSALRDRYAAELERVRREARSRPSLLPPAAAVAAGGAGGGGAQQQCYYREELARRLDAALERFRAGATELLLRGDAARLDLAACARWAVEAGRTASSGPPLATPTGTP